MPDPAVRPFTEVRPAAGGVPFDQPAGGVPVDQPAGGVPVDRREWAELDLVRDWREFLAAPDRWLRHLSG